MELLAFVILYIFYFVFLFCNILIMELRLIAPRKRNANFSLLKKNMQIPFKWQVGEGLLTQLTFCMCECVCVSALYANTAESDEV